VTIFLIKIPYYSDCLNLILTKLVNELTFILYYY